MSLAPGTTLGPYQIVSQLGSGGMGVVYEARDPRLKRTVAIKLLPPNLTKDDTAKQRFLQEAQAASALDHPNICTIYEINETDDDQLYLVMAHYEGEALNERIARGPVELDHAIDIATQVGEGLAKAHAAGIVHRDIKPANLMVTTDGTVKILGFGLAKLAGTEGVTQTGMTLGTVAYMSPEQARGQEVDRRTDIWSLGVVLYEMLAGQPPFQGDNLLAVAEAIRESNPSPLPGGGGGAVEGIVRRCLAKSPQQRYTDASAVATALGASTMRTDSSTTASPPSLTRLMVLPFKLVRPDPEVDFLSFSLPDALIASLTGLGPLVVRSSHVAQQFAGDTPDLRRIASAGQVDVVLMGSLLRSGDRLRLVAQLVETSGGEVLWSKTMQVGTGDAFEVQDTLARQVVESLAVPLTTIGRGLLGRDVPATGHAYELYLRANHLSHDTVERSRFLAARELYAACLEEDPNYAPGWAQLGRVHRVLAKYGDERDDRGVERAREAFERAFALNPDLPLAHHLYTYFEIEQLGRAQEAMIRLLGRVGQSPNDPDLYAGLVVACRYAGLLDASVAAHRRAYTLDPAVRTSVENTWLRLGDYERCQDPGSLFLFLYQHDRQEEASNSGTELSRRRRNQDPPRSCFLRPWMLRWEIVRTRRGRWQAVCVRRDFMIRRDWRTSCCSWRGPERMRMP